jgi:hypothetical protein
MHLARCDGAAAPPRVSARVCGDPGIAFVHQPKQKKENTMKNEKKTRTKIENLKAVEGSVGHEEMSAGELRLVTGGLARLPEVSSSTVNCDVDCD